MGKTVTKVVGEKKNSTKKNCKRPKAATNSTGKDKTITLQKIIDNAKKHPLFNSLRDFIDVDKIESHLTSGRNVKIKVSKNDASEIIKTWLAQNCTSLEGRGPAACLNRFIMKNVVDTMCASIFDS